MWCNFWFFIARHLFLPCSYPWPTNFNYCHPLSGSGLFHQLSRSCINCPNHRHPPAWASTACVNSILHHSASSSPTMVTSCGYGFRSARYVYSYIVRDRYCMSICVPWPCVSVHVALHCVSCVRLFLVAGIHPVHLHSLSLSLSLSLSFSLRLAV